MLPPLVHCELRCGRALLETRRVRPARNDGPERHDRLKSGLPYERSFSVARKTVLVSDLSGAEIPEGDERLLMDLDDRGERPRFLIHDRDRKYSRAFDAIFGSEGIEIVRTPVQAPNANAYAERWVGRGRRECLDRLLIFGRSQLEYVFRVYIRHFN